MKSLLTRFSQTLLLAGGFASLGACATSECLRLPVSDKIANDAVARCQLEARQSPDRRDVFERAIKLAWARGLYEQMVALSKGVLRHDKERSDARYYLAVGLRKLGRCDDALKLYRAYAELRSDDPDPYFGMGLCQRAGGDTAAALTSFRTYLQKEKRDDREAWREKARAQIAEMTGAATMARRPVRTAPRSLKIAGSIRKAEAGRVGAPIAPKKVAPKKAAPRAPAPPADCGKHERAFKADPFATKAYAAYAECALARKEAAKVVKTMRMAIRDNPDFHRGWLLLGKGYKAQGDASAAKRAFARACKEGVGEACSL